MNNNLLGEQIAKFRKAAGMTQEDLGKAVGISAQAVSRWECGGAPDVTLLPAVADALGVTIDALFGLERGETLDVKDAVQRWIASVPRNQRLNELCRLVWSAIKGTLSYRRPDPPVSEGREVRRHRSLRLREVHAAEAPAGLAAGLRRSDPV